MKTMLVSGMILCLAGLAFGQAELSEGQKDSIFIGAVKVMPSVTQAAADSGTGTDLQRIADSLDAQLMMALSATRVFDIVERNRLSELQQEQNLAAAGLVEANDPKVAEQFKLAGARFAFFPQIDGFEDRSARVDHQQINRSSLQREMFLSAVVRIVDTTTGRQLADVPSVQLTKAENIQLAAAGQVPGSDQLIVALAKDMANALCQQLIANVRPAKVLAINGQQIMINRGIQAGFVPGLAVEIFAVEDVKDEDTGEVFKNEVPVGQGTVVRADGQKSFADIQGENLGIAKGCRVRLTTPAPAAAPVAGQGSFATGQRQQGAPASSGTAPAQALPPGSSEKPW